MERQNQTQERFDTRWFQDRAFRSLQKIRDTEWDYSDSLLLYLPGSDENYDTVQETDTPYHTLVTAPERAYLRDIAEDIVAALPNEFEYIDLGPGTEHKEQFIFDALERAGKRCVYRPVDISERYLKLSAEHAGAQGIAVQPIRSPFEALPQVLGSSRMPRFVSLGLTYSNYHPEKILPLVKEIAGEGGVVFIEAQIRERTDMDTIQEIYRGVADLMAGDKIRLLGLDPEKDIERSDVTDEVRVWYTLKVAPRSLPRRVYEPGTDFWFLNPSDPHLRVFRLP